MKPITYTFSQKQIRDLDTAGLTGCFELTKLSPSELRALCGAVRISITGVSQMEQVFTENEPRRFFRKLCSEWPVGYFLRLEPITSIKDTDRLLDAGIFISLGLCHADLTFAEWDRSGISDLNFKAEQFSDWLEQTTQQAIAVARHAGFSVPAIQRRRRLIAETVLTFFELGERTRQDQ